MAFAPDDATLLVVVNLSGRIDLFDISNPGRPVEIAKDLAGASGVAFTPKGTARNKVRVVSRGRDGTIRLWTPDGKAVAKPFKGHTGAVISLTFSPDGTDIVSGSLDQTIRLWTPDGKAWRNRSRDIPAQ